MKNSKLITVFILSVFYASSLYAQNDSIATPVQVQPSYQQSHYQGVDFADELPYVRIGAGVWVPQGSLSDTFNPSPMFEFALDFSNGNQLRSVEFVMQFILPNQQRLFIYDTDAGTFTGSSNLILNGMLRFKKPIYNKGKSKFEIGAGLGISAMFISENDIDFKDAIPYESANAILFTPGVAWYYKFKDASVLTLGADLQFAPYTIEGAATPKIGSVAITPKLTYRF